LYQYDDVFERQDCSVCIALRTRRSGTATPRHSPYVIELTPAERAALEAQARRITPPYRDVIRAKIVLLAAISLGNNQIVARLDISRQIGSR
jgi:hypothetical protein